MPTFVNDIGIYIGVGRQLTVAEFDGMNYNFHTRLLALEENPPVPVEISAITQPTASTFIIHLENGDSYGPFNLPVALFQPRTWAADTTLNALDVFGIDTQGIFMVLRTHTTAVDEVFDPAREVDGLPAYHFLLPPGVQGAAGDKIEVGLFADRSTYDAHAIPFYYISLDGYGNTGDPLVIFERSDAVSELWIGAEAGGLPAWSGADEGKALCIVAGVPAWAIIEIPTGTGGGSATDELPPYAVENNGQVLMVVAGALAWATPEAASGGGGFTRVVKTVTTDTYTLISGDELKRNRFTHVSGCIISMPDDVFTDGAEIPMIGVNGQLVLGGAAVPTHTADTAPISRAAGSQILAAYTGAATYDLTGDLELVSA